MVSGVCKTVLDLPGDQGLVIPQGSYGVRGMQSSSGDLDQRI